MSHIEQNSWYLYNIFSESKNNRFLQKEEYIIDNLQKRRDVTEFVHIVYPKII